MNILYLGPPSEVESFLRASNKVVTSESRYPPFLGHDWIVSYGYRHIISPAVINQYPGRIINLHISYLPWNRGASPNLWSFLDDTPKGVTIHQMDSGIDTGPILLQQQVAVEGDDTLRTMYLKLHEAIQRLFILNWQRIVRGEITPLPQTGESSFHTRKESESHLKHLNYDMTIGEWQDGNAICTAFPFDGES